MKTCCKRKTCRSCGKVKVESKFFDDKICKECLFICFRCGSNLNSLKCCKLCSKSNTSLIAFENTHLQDVGDILKTLGKDLFNAFRRRHENFYRITYSIFSSHECAEILEWISKSKRKIQPINFGIQNTEDLNKRYINLLIHILLFLRSVYLLFILGK